MKHLKLTERKGLANIVVLSVMAILAISLPIATKLVQQNQENRSSAKEDTDVGVSTSCNSSNYPDKCKGGYFYYCEKGKKKSDKCTYGCHNSLKCNNCNPKTYNNKCSNGKLNTCVDGLKSTITCKKGCSADNKACADTSVTPTKTITPTPVSQTNAKCGTANDFGYASPPPTVALCSSGDSKWVNDSGTDGAYYWKCVGSNNNSVDCATKPIGKCGSSEQKKFKTRPNTNLCSIGSHDSPDNEDEYQWYWGCSRNGTITACTAYKTVECGSANNQSYYSKPSSNLCKAGKIVWGNITDTDFNWSCQGKADNNTVKCSAMIKIDGKCGDDSGKYFDSESDIGSDRVCEEGGYPDSGIINTSDGFTWICQGQQGGKDVSCKAYKNISGKCGSANGGVYYEEPLSGLCDQGKQVWVDRSAIDGNYNWVCSGAGSGTDAQCSAKKANKT